MQIGKSRLEAFSDGVLAIILTIMVLELKTPHSHDLQALVPMIPVFISYILSFVFIGIYWNNHHHLFHAVQKISGAVLWANLHLLFWLSLVPFSTAWMGETGFTEWPVALYGLILFMSGLAYFILVRTLLKAHDKTSHLHRAIGSDFKGKISLLAYAIGIGVSFCNSWIAYAFYGAVAILWLVPDRRIETLE